MAQKEYTEAGRGWGVAGIRDPVSAKARGAETVVGAQVQAKRKRKHKGREGEEKGKGRGLDLTVGPGGWLFA